MDEKKIIELYNDLNSSQKVANLIGVSKRTVLNVLKRNNVDTSKNSVTKTEEEKEMVIALYRKYGSYKTVSNITGFKCETIKKIVGSDSDKYHQKYKYPILLGYNETIFDTIDTEEKAYWLGFIYADGCVTDNKGYPCALSIGLKSSDQGHLYKFCDFMRADKKAIKLRGDSVHIKLCSRHLCESLVALGVVPRKSLVLEPHDVIKNFPDNLMRAFLRGYCDGDGTLYFRSNGRFVLGFIGTYQIIDFISNWLCNKLEIPNTKASNRNNVNTYEWKREGCYAKIIAQYLYKDSTTYLDRKYEIARLVGNF